MFCKSCGAPLPEGVQHCPQCGAQVSKIDLNKKSADAGAGTNANTHTTEGGYTYGDGTYRDPNADHVNSGQFQGDMGYGYGAGGYSRADHTAEFSYKEIDEYHWAYILAYFGFLFFIPLVVCPDYRLGRFHANQGLLLLLFGVAVGVISGVINALGIIPALGWFFSMCGGIISWAGGLAEFAAFIFAIVNIINKRAVELPVIGGISLIKY